MPKPLVSASSVYFEQRLIARDPSVILPLTVAAGGLASIITDPVVVPANEYWLLSSMGASITYSAPGLVLQAATGRFRPGPKIQVLFNVVGSTISDVRLPVSIGQINASADWFSCSLQGVEMTEGDEMVFAMLIQNPTAGPLDVTALQGGMRYRAFQVVSDAQVAAIQIARQDFGLDRRLRGGGV